MCYFCTGDLKTQSGGTKLMIKSNRYKKVGQAGGDGCPPPTVVNNNGTGSTGATSGNTTAPASASSQATRYSYNDTRPTLGLPLSSSSINPINYNAISGSVLASLGAEAISGRLIPSEVTLPQEYSKLHVFS
jgi:hypothetical protein